MCFVPRLLALVEAPCEIDCDMLEDLVRGYVVPKGYIDGNDFSGSPFVSDAVDNRSMSPNFRSKIKQCLDVYPTHLHFI